jgi:hypothetical protein
VEAGSLDVRHAYHQAFLPRSISELTTISLFENVFMTSRVFPMGLHATSGVFSAISWSAAIANLEGENRRRERENLGIDWDGDTFPKFLRFLPLTKSGMVVILIDNFFVFHQDRKIRDRWVQKFVTECNRCAITLKHADGKQPVSETGGFVENVLEDAAELCTITIPSRRAPKNEAEDPRSICFTGISISGRGMRVEKVMQRREELEDDTAEKYTTSFRELSGVMSQAMWSYRVRRVRLLDREPFMQIFKIAQPGPGQSWSSSVTLEGSHLAALRAAYREARENKWAPFDTSVTVTDASRVAYMATDAALDEKCRGTGWLYAHDDWAEEIAPVVEENEHKHDHIALGELQALLDAIDSSDQHAGWLMEDAVRRGVRTTAPHGEVDVFVVAVDSMAVKGMVERAYSKNEAARELLRELFAKLGSRKIFLQWVQSKRNPADEPSRSRMGIPEKWKECLAELKKVGKEAIKAKIRGNCEARKK